MRRLFNTYISTIRNLEEVQNSYYEGNLLKEQLMGVHDKHILRHVLIRSTLAVPNKEEREWGRNTSLPAMEKILLAKEMVIFAVEISHQDCANHRIFLVPQLLISPQYLQSTKCCISPTQPAQGAHRPLGGKQGGVGQGKEGVRCGG